MAENPLRVLITGCSSGIGEGFAKAFAERGATLFATARKREKIALDENERTTLLNLDVTSKESVTLAMAQIEREAGGIDILINNAGYGLIAPVAEMDIEALRLQLETNVIGAVRMIEAFVPGMIERHSGTIVNVGSVSGITPTPFSGAYCASKAALHSLSDALRMELLPFGVKVIILLPGGIKSQFAERAGLEAEQAAEKFRIYAPFKESVAQRAKMSQTSPTGVEDFVADAMKTILSPNPPAIRRYGHGATLLPLLKRALPESRLDKMLAKRFGLIKS